MNVGTQLKPALVACVIALLTATLACDGGSPPAAPSPTPSVVTVTVTGTTPAVGGRSQFTADASFSDGRIQNVTTARPSGPRPRSKSRR